MSDDLPIELDALLAELNQVARQLDDLPESAKVERDGLLDRRRQLRAVAAQLRPEASRELLERELSDLKRHRQEIFDLHLSVGHVGHAHAGGLDPHSTYEFNRRVDETWDRKTIERRIKQIEERLAELET